ncbi:hypothetical protein GQR58_029157 [Nymphon striatum]|nr:hypothetical protein GQR58_029157 [Nymphon striatum]
MVDVWCVAVRAGRSATSALAGSLRPRPPHVDALDACRVAFHLDAAMRTIVAALNVGASVGTTRRSNSRMGCRESRACHTLNLLRRSSGDRRQTGLTRGERGRGPALTPRQMAPGFVVVIDDVHDRVFVVGCWQRAQIGVSTTNCRAS